MKRKYTKPTLTKVEQLNTRVPIWQICPQWWHPKNWFVWHHHESVDDTFCVIDHWYQLSIVQFRTSERM